MPATWPVSIQQLLNESGFSLQVGNTVLRSDMEIGPAKVRRRMTKSNDILSATIILNHSEYHTFYTFFDVSLNGGATSFNFAHPITGVLTEFRFRKEPVFRSIGGGNFEVAMEWESLS